MLLNGPEFSDEVFGEYVFGDDVFFLGIAMMCSFLGYKFQTRVAFLPPRIVQQRCVAWKRVRKSVNFSSKTCGIYFFSRGFNFNSNTYLLRGNFLVKLPKILLQKWKWSCHGSTATSKTAGGKIPSGQRQKSGQIAGFLFRGPPQRQIVVFVGFKWFDISLRVLRNMKIQQIPRIMVMRSPKCPIRVFCRVCRAARF